MIFPDEFTEVFFTWMKSRGLKPQDLNTDLATDKKNISNWRTRGIPKSKVPLCKIIMAQRESEFKQELSLQNTILALELDRVTFNLWNREALKEGKLVEEWIINQVNKTIK